MKPKIINDKEILNFQKTYLNKYIFKDVLEQGCQNRFKGVEFELNTRTRVLTPLLHSNLRELTSFIFTCC